MAKKLFSPYRKNGAWLRGNLHVHSKLSDGERTPQEIIDAFAARSYDVLMISDHNVICPYDGLDAKGLILIPGNEVSNELPHIQHINARTVVAPDDDRQKVLDDIAADGGLAVLNHPNWWRDFDHIPVRKMLEWHGYHGIEIVNSLAKWQYGNHLAVDKWDQILSAGRHVVAFGNDDSHSPKRDGESCNIFLAKARTKAAVLESIRQGSLYVSTGVAIEKIVVTPKSVTVKTSNAGRIAVVTRLGKRIRQHEGSEYTFELEGHQHVQDYFRFECYGASEQAAWTQAFWWQDAAPAGWPAR